MSNVNDILLRSKALEKKYDKYLQPEKAKGRESAVKGDDFDYETAVIAEAAQEVAEAASKVPDIKDRTQVALANADIRKRKSALIADVAKLKTLIKKGKVNKEQVVLRQQKANELEGLIASIPDGMNIARKRPGGPSGSKGSAFGGTGKPVEVKLEMGQLSDDAGYYAATEENTAFQAEYDQRRAQQDQVLDEIERGLGNLQNIATDVGGELNKQDVLLDEIDERMDAATKSVQTNNQKLAGVLRRVRSQRNFCIDIILITVLLAVGGYIYSIVA